MTTFSAPSRRRSAPSSSPATRAGLAAWLDAVGEPAASANLPASWEERLRLIFPGWFTHPFGARHRHFWEHVESIKRAVRPAPYVGCWPRKGGKSVSVEAALIDLGGRDIRDYFLYVSETQELADKHVQTLAARMESSEVAIHYPRLAERAAGKYGQSRGWRRQRLVTSGGFVVDALGLETAARGIKLEQVVPDGCVLDDIDGRHDSARIIAKKKTTITDTILQALASHAVVFYMQNKIIEDGLMGRLVGGRADFLQDAIMYGPEPAVEDLELSQATDGRFRIVGGTATWEGQSLDDCQNIIFTSGPTSFRREQQHDTEAGELSLFSHIDFDMLLVERDEVPDLREGCLWVDPTISDTEESDCVGLQADAIFGRPEKDETGDWTIYRLYSYEGRCGPEAAMQRALKKAVDLRAEWGIPFAVGVETDQGGQTWEPTYREAWRRLVEDNDVSHITEETPRPEYRSAKAGAGHGGKNQRWNRALSWYEKGRFRHVRGTHTTLERALKRAEKPYDLRDSQYWSGLDLIHPEETRAPVSTPEILGTW